MNSPIYDKLEPREAWRHFAALNSIPRPSGEEGAAREYVKQIAREAGARFDEDARGNIVVRCQSASENGRAFESPTTMIQAHLDMVCQKLPEVAHDFSRDAIRVRRDGDIIRATGTTLGADNGLGAALALALLTTPNLRHGDLELLFTVEEETGLVGAAALDEKLLRADYLINLDSEDPDELTVGCAGGAGVDLILPIERENLGGGVPRAITVSGLKGGHSGVQIHEPLGNAIKILVEVLRAADGDFRLIAIDGGSTHNAIPRDATARVWVEPNSLADFESALGKIAAMLRAQWRESESGLKIEIAQTQSESALTAHNARRVLDFLAELPHGVVQMSAAFADKVETSSNLAIVETRESEVKVHLSSRSFVAGELEQQQQKVMAIGARFGATCEAREGYPGWEPNPHSRLLELARRAFEETYGKAPQVQVVHAGLECGVIVAKHPMDAISFGPLIRFAHSPDECADASTVASTWRLLLALLAKIDEK